ncbi:ribonuclease R [candidate division KSB1 bacterium]|nr:ribonuclease R [candidate division KSB1 bacterium]
MNELSKKVIELCRYEPLRSYRAKEIQRRLKVPPGRYQGLRAVLDELVSDGELVKVKKNRFSIRKSNEIVGELRVNSQGYGFVSQDAGDDVFISMKNMGQALHKDKVRVRLFAKTSGKNAEGQIVEVLERSRQTIVGTFRRGRKYGYIVPDDLKLQRDVIIAPGEELGAREGQKVVCQIEQWEHRGLNPSGRVIQVLGFPEDVGVDVLSIVHQHEISTRFADSVLQQVEQIADDLAQNELNRRVDLRQDTIFTIDPEDAKDFDDAVSLDQTDDGQWRLGVHIADVSHYVTQNSALDREALERGTSVYLVDRVIPMLPEQLSNDLCSLKEGAAKLTFSVFMMLSKEGKVTSYDIKESVISSKKRFNYHQVQKIIDGELDSPFVTKLREMHKLSQLLIRNRRNRGSIDFDTVEVEIPLNEKGEPIEIKKRLRLDSHRLIEEFMLLANETVAKHVGIVLKEKLQKELPFIYRIHESPDKQSVMELLQVAHAFGMDFSPPAKISPRFFQNVAAQFQEHPASTVLQDQLLRTMMKAKYSPENVGHFGLAYRYYTHFTSPIRRYPDLIVHRLLKKYANRDFDESPAFYQEIEQICQKSTSNEIRAQNAERDSIKLKQLQFLERHMQDVFEGIIIRIVNFGFFVLLPEFQLDGLVHITSLDDDYYIVDDQHYRIYGQKSGVEYKLSEKIKVRVVRVDRNENLIDFVMSE